MNAGVQLRADSALETRRPPAVLHLDLVNSVLPVFPQPLTIKSGIQVIPRQHLDVLALAGGVPVKIDSAALQALIGTGRPQLVGEVLAPAIEPAAVPPDRLDDRTDAAITPTQLSLDDARLPIVIAKSDRPVVLPVTADRVPQRS